MKTSAHLHLEVLEDRCTPATFGNAWPDAGHLSLSFAPDGTQVGNRQSELFSHLNTQASTQDWQLTVLRAFQTWAVQGNIDLVLTPDAKQPFGTRGALQGDPRFGDIRVAAYPFAPQGGGIEDMAIGSPFDPTAGTWSGDVKLNSGYTFGLSAASALDLYTVMLHEAGHSLGLGHSDDPQSAMFEHYKGARSGLNATDIAALQAVYGKRSPDGFEDDSGNEKFSTASVLPLANVLGGTIELKADGDVTTLADHDVYKFNSLLGSGGLAIQLHASTHSLLTARVTVYDAAKNVVGSSVAVNALNNDLTVTLSKVKPLSTYYVKVESGTNDVFGIGSYQLSVKLVPLGIPVESVLTTVDSVVSGLLNNDYHTNDSFLTALLLPALTQSADARFDYAFKGSISDSSDVDLYKIKAPTAPAGAATVLTAMIWGLESSTLLPTLTVYAANQSPVNAEVLVNDGGNYTVQIPNAVSGATYYVKAAAVQPQGSNNVGNYFLGVDFGAKAVSLKTFVEGTLEQSKAQSANSLKVTNSQLFHFVLSADAGTSAVDAAVRMTVYDAKGNVLLSFVAGAGQTVSRDLFLSKGDYTVRFAAGTKSGAALSKLAYRLRGVIISDPVGPEAHDSSSDPSGSSSSSSTSSDSNFWGGGSNSGLSPQDPYSDPYSTV